MAIRQKWRVRKMGVDTTYIIAFFGTGKTTYIAKHPEADAVDLVDAIPGKGPDIETLTSYKHHKIVMADPDWVQVFNDAGVKYRVVVPDASLKTLYTENFKERFKKKLGGGSEAFCNRVLNHWDSIVRTLSNDNENVISLTVLDEGQWLEDVMDKLI